MQSVDYVASEMECVLLSVLVSDMTFPLVVDGIQKEDLHRAEDTCHPYDNEAAESSNCHKRGSDKRVQEFSERELL